MKNKYYKENKKIEREHKTHCCICNESSKCCLEFHHVHDKLWSISQSTKFLPTDLFIKEINKCVCICSNCHRKLHAGLIKLNNGQ